MPNSVSAKKRLRQNLSRRERNRAQRAALRSQIRKVRVAIAAGDAQTAETEYRLLVKKIDRAASKNLLHSNTVARVKSRITKAIKGIKGAKTAKA
jgi:small subunit ribosomal protein S20